MPYRMLNGRAVIWSALPYLRHPCRGSIRVPESCLHFDDRRFGGPQRMDAEAGIAPVRPSAGVTRSRVIEPGRFTPSTR